MERASTSTVSLGSRRPLAPAALLLAAGALLPLAACAGGGRPDPGVRPGEDAPRSASYHVYVANESSDVVSRVRFVPEEGATVEASIAVGVMPGDLDGAHGLAVSPDGRSWYLTTAHGSPFGRLWKFRTGSDEVLGVDTLGLFPATIGLTPDGSEAFVVNFNLHGDPEPSSVSAVATEPVLEEVARIPVCVRPHGSRVSADGRRHYSVCGPDDRLTEIAVEDRTVRRTLALPSTSGGERCAPSWAEPGVDGGVVYVACNGGAEVYEVATDGDELRVGRRFATGPAPYNLEAVAGGRLLLATNKAGSSVSVIDLETGSERERVATSREVPHGVVASPDGRWAFVSNEARGGTRGTVDVIDLERAERVASVEVEHQPGGIDFWKVERPGILRDPPPIRTGGGRGDRRR